MLYGPTPQTLSSSIKVVENGIEQRHCLRAPKMKNCSSLHSTLTAVFKLETKNNTHHEKKQILRNFAKKWLI